MDNLSKRLVFNALHNTVGRVWVIVLTLVLTAYTVNRLGNEAFAMWAVVLAIVSYASIADLGTGNAFSKFVAERRALGDEDGLSSVVSGGLCLYLAGAVLLGAIGWSCEPWIATGLRIPMELQSDFEFIFKVGLFAFAGQHAANAFRGVLFGLQRVDQMRRIWMWSTAVQAAGAVLALESGGGVRGLAVSHAVFVMVAWLLSWRAVIRLCPELRIAPRFVRWPLLKSMIGFGSKLQAISIANLIDMQLDKLLLTASAGLQWTAFYELGQKAARAVQAVPHTMTEVVLPAISEVNAIGDIERIRDLYREGSRWVGMATLSLVGWVVIGAPWIVRVWVGPGYEWAARALAVMAVVLGIRILTGMGSSLVRGMDHAGIEVRARVATALGHLALGVILVPLWGLPGALTAFAISGMASDAYFIASLHRFIGYPVGRLVREAFLRPAAATVLAGLTGGVCGAWVSGRYTEPGRLEACAVLGTQTVAYVAVLLVALVGLGGMDSRDRRLVGTLLSRFRTIPRRAGPPTASDGDGDGVTKGSDQEALGDDQRMALINDIAIPNAAIKYILFQRTGYLMLSGTILAVLRRVSPWLVSHGRRLRRWSPWFLYRGAVALESGLQRRRVKKRFATDMLEEYTDIAPWLPERCGRILDIGCGVAGIDVLLHRHYARSPDIEFHLLDKSSTNQRVHYGFRSEGAFYNSLDIAGRMLAMNGVPTQSIHVLEATPSGRIDLGVSVDLAVSLLSWGFHYPVSTYLDRVAELLSPGGRLIIDVRHDTGGEAEIAARFGDVRVISETAQKKRLLAVKQRDPEREVVRSAAVPIHLATRSGSSA